MKDLNVVCSVDTRGSEIRPIKRSSPKFLSASWPHVPQQISARSGTHALERLRSCVPIMQLSYCLAQFILSSVVLVDFHLCSYVSTVHSIYVDVVIYCTVAQPWRSTCSFSAFRASLLYNKLQIVRLYPSYFDTIAYLHLFNLKSVCL